MNKAKEILKLVGERYGQGLKETQPELNDVVYSVLSDAQDDLNRLWEWNGELEEIEHESRSGFISYNDGGYKATVFVTQGSLMSSGEISNLPKKAQDSIKEVYDYSLELVLDQFKDEYKEELEGVPEDKINYHDLNELGKGDLAERLSEMETEGTTDEQSTVMIFILAMYNADDNSFTVQGVVNWEAPYHRNKAQFEDFKEVKVSAGGDISSFTEKFKKAVDTCLSFCGVGGL